MGIFRSKDEPRRKAIDGRYSVTDDGVVWSGGLPLEPIGGVGVNLHGRRVKIAYLVARAFVPNGECREYVRHKNGVFEDNRAENLEWCDRKEERRRGRRPLRIPVRCVGSDGEVVGVYDGLVEASAATGVGVHSIRACIYGRQKRAGGLFFEMI